MISLISSSSIPQAYKPATTAPIEVPEIMSILMPSSFNFFKNGSCEKDFMPPPDKATPILIILNAPF